MARQVRIQFEGAIYHVMARGNNGSGIFFGNKGCKMFLDTINEACERTGWKLHAYVLMGNHYHLLLETPEANLVDGMKWLQGTYTQRVNAWRGCRGHLFQGRYKAQLVNGSDSDGTYFKIVSDYIHLNPARARMVGKGKQWKNLSDYPWSSLPLYLNWKNKRPDWLLTERVFNSHCLKDNTRGREAYTNYLNKRTIEEQSEEDHGSYSALRSGWCIGDISFRQKMLDKIEATVAKVKKDNIAGAAIIEHNEERAKKLIDAVLSEWDISPGELERMAKGASVKRAIAVYVSGKTTVTSEWIAKRLHMGHPSVISQSKTWSKETAEGVKWMKKLSKIKD